MKCLLKYQWVKLDRARLPSGKGIMSYWLKLASSAAYRNGSAYYCGHLNEVKAGSWSGGIVGLKSILGINKRVQALCILDKLVDLGLVRYTLDTQTKKLTYTVVDWVVECSGAACQDGAVYAANDYGFLCIPRKITEILAKRQHVFEEADAWLDLWCHTVYHDQRNIFSEHAPVIQLERANIRMTLEKLGDRWGWEKTKVWRFLQKYNDVFRLCKLPGSFGCVIYNLAYPHQEDIEPTPVQTIRIFNEIRILSLDACKACGPKLLMQSPGEETDLVSSDHSICVERLNCECRVALFQPYTRAYISHCCIYCNSYQYGNSFHLLYDCYGISAGSKYVPEETRIRGPCE